MSLIVPVCGWWAMQARYSLGTLSQSGQCSFHPLLCVASPMATIGPPHDDDPSLQARGLVALFFTPSGADSTPLDASSCMAGLVACRCGVHLVVLQSSVHDSVWVVAGLLGLASSMLAHQTVRYAPNQRCSEHHSNAIQVPMLQTYLEGTHPFSWFIPSQCSLQGISRTSNWNEFFWNETRPKLKWVFLFWKKSFLFLSKTSKCTMFWSKNYDILFQTKFLLGAS